MEDEKRTDDFELIREMFSTLSDEDKEYIRKKCIEARTLKNEKTSSEENEETEENQEAKTFSSDEKVDVSTKIKSVYSIIGTILHFIYFIYLFLTTDLKLFVIVFWIAFVITIFPDVAGKISKKMNK